MNQVFNLAVYQVPSSQVPSSRPIAAKSYAAKSFAVSAVLWLMLMVCMAVPASAAQLSDSDLQQSMERQNFPWYDADADGLKATPLLPRTPSKNMDRGEIAPRPATAPKTPGPAAGVNPAAQLSTAFNYIAWGIAGLVIAGVIAGLIYAFLRLESDPGESPTRRRSNRIQDHIKHLPFDLEQETGDFRSQARRAYDIGDYRNSIIYLFGDVLVTLENEHLIRLRKSKTNRHYLKEVRHLRPIASFYIDVMNSFEDAFFGRKEITQKIMDGHFGGFEKFRQNVATASASRGKQTEVFEAVGS